MVYFIIIFDDAQYKKIEKFMSLLKGCSYINSSKSFFDLDISRGINLMDCIPIRIQYMYYSHQSENESRPDYLKKNGWEELNGIQLNHHNMYQRMNHRHKWSKNHSWKNRLFIFLIWKLKGINLPAGRLPFYIKR